MSRNVTDVREALAAAQEAASWAADPKIREMRAARGIDQARLAREAARRLDLAARRLSAKEEAELSDDDVAQIQVILDGLGA